MKLGAKYLSTPLEMDLAPRFTRGSQCMTVSEPKKDNEISCLS